MRYIFAALLVLMSTLILVVKPEEYNIKETLVLPVPLAYSKEWSKRPNPGTIVNKNLDNSVTYKHSDGGSNVILSETGDTLQWVFFVNSTRIEITDVHLKVTDDSTKISRSIKINTGWFNMMPESLYKVVFDMDVSITETKIEKDYLKEKK